MIKMLLVLDYRIYEKNEEDIAKANLIENWQKQADEETFPKE